MSFAYAETSMSFSVPNTQLKVGNIVSVDLVLNYKPEGNVNAISLSYMQIVITYDKSYLEPVPKQFNYNKDIFANSIDISGWISDKKDNSIYYIPFWWPGEASNPVSGSVSLGNVVFKAIRPGSTKVICEVSEIAIKNGSGTMQVTVDPVSMNADPSLVTIVLPPAEDIVAGPTVKFINFTATAPDILGNQVPYQPLWSVNNLTGIASINTAGSFTGYKPGKVSVTARAVGGTAGVFDTKEVEVLPPPAVLGGKVKWLGQQVTNISGGKTVDYSGIKVELVGTSKSSLTNTTGSYFIDKLTAGKYNVHAAIPKYLPVKDKSVDLTAGVTSEVNFDFVPGDVYPDSQNRIDLYDLIKISRCYGTKPGNARWDGLSDLDGDGYVGWVDWNSLRVNYGRVAD